MGKLRTAIDRAKRQLSDLERARKRIFEEQKRIRNNMNRVRAKTDLHRRYVAKLDSQETELEKLESRYESSRKAVRAAQEELGTYVSNLNL